MRRQKRDGFSQKSKNKSKESGQTWKVYKRMRRNERKAKRIREGKAEKSYVQRLFFSSKRRTKRVKQKK